MTGVLTMRDLLLQQLPAEEVRESGIKGVTLFRVETGYKAKPQLYQSQIIILAQGKKNIYLGGKTYTYDPDHYYVQTVPLPIQCEAVIENGQPMLGMVLNIDPQIIGEILFEMDIPPSPDSGEICDSIYDAPVTDEMRDAATRLVATLRSENDRKVLGPVYLKELLYRILCGENGRSLSELVVNRRSYYQIARVISKIHEDYSRTYEIKDLAREAGMSATAFHSTFKSMTSTSPLQYIKNIRLLKAKEMIQQEGEKAYAAAMRVGYESTSQFSREYKRSFGVTPAQDKKAV